MESLGEVGSLQVKPWWFRTLSEWRKGSVFRTTRSCQIRELLYRGTVDWWYRRDQRGGIDSVDSQLSTGPIRLCRGMLAYQFFHVLCVYRIFPRRQITDPMAIECGKSVKEQLGWCALCW